MLYFIVNKTARTGNGYSSWPTIKKILNNQNIIYKAYLTEYTGHAKELAYEISSLNEKSIFLIVLGGDGTINEVVNGITDFEKVHLGIIPAGSGNDFANGVGLSKDIEKSILTILYYVESQTSDYSFNKKEFHIDLGCAQWIADSQKQQRYFVISSGLGMDAIVCKKALSSKLKKILNYLHLGKLTYLLLTIHSLFTMKTADCTITFDKNDEIEYHRLIFSAAMNLRAEGGGIPMAPSAHCTDGHLTMCTAHSLAKGATFFLLPFLVAGKHTSLNCFDIHPFQTCRLTFSTPMTLHLDGEYGGEMTELTFSCLPKKLKLIDTRI